jgi:hypothetical protein
LAALAVGLIAHDHNIKGHSFMLMGRHAAADVPQYNAAAA